MRRGLSHFFEAMFFQPRWYHFGVIFSLLPLSFFYGFGMALRRFFTPKRQWGIPIVSIGNLQVGGSGKTPVLIALAKEYEGVCVISRGYGRKSRGLVVVSQKGQIEVDVAQSGDEAMLMAQALPQASVIVSESRQEAIVLAKSQGAKVIFLDDGFNRVEIAKYELLLRPQKERNPFVFPAGPLRECWFTRYLADAILKEGRDFQREVEVHTLGHSRLLLVTAISQPQRLEPYLPKGIVERLYLPDHSYFDVEAIEHLCERVGATAIVCTSKDRVKMVSFQRPIIEMKLTVKIAPWVDLSIRNYIEGEQNEK
jgi:tetraacyldisaccharide 4'-kinase